MRKRHWIKKFLGGALLAAAPAVGLAQAPEGSWGSPATGYAPYVDPQSPQAAAYAPTYAGYQQAGWPEGATQWPYISPYTAPPVDEHTYQNGFWFNRQVRDTGRKYFTYMAATFNTFADPDDVVVGDNNAPGFLVLPTTTTTNNTTNNAVLLPDDIVARHTWDDVENHLSGGGFRGTFGWMNPNDTGVFITGFWAEEGSAVYDPHNPIGDPSRPESTLSALYGVPLFDGQGETSLPLQPGETEPVVVPGGGTQGYDMQYKLAWQSQAYGIGGGFMGSSFYSTDTIKLRPTFGLRYLNLRENATFDGQNSNLGYLVSTGGSGTTGGGNNANNGTPRGRPVPGSVVGVGLVDPLVSHLRSNTKSQLAGPEIGLALDLGGDKFLIQLQSKLGILANHSTREIDGFGIGRTQVQVGSPAIVPIPLDPTLTSFQQQESTTSVSPSFEQSVMVRMPVLQFVPIIRKSRLFENAEFQVGYTWTVAGAVYRPGNVIDWAGYPNFPTINSNKTTWFMHSVSWGVEWGY
ncbi:hypothetical protein GC163_19695 [bacterium]|nr:hypothetical protein [bacterium]